MSAFACVLACCQCGRWGGGVPLLWKASIIVAFSSVSSDHRLGGQPIPSRHCLAMGPAIVLLGCMFLKRGGASGSATDVWR